MSSISSLSPLRAGLWILVGVLFGLVADRVGGEVCRRLYVRSQFRLAAIYNDRTNPEILVAGNSRAMQSINAIRTTQALGRPVYNIGFNGLDAEVVCLLVKDAVERHSSISTVLLEASCFWNNEEAIGNRADIKPCASVSSRLMACLRERIPSDYWGCRISGLYAYNSEIFHRALRYEYQSDQDYATTAVISREMIAAGVPSASIKAGMSDHQAALLGDLSGYLANRGCKLVLVIAPFHPSYKMAFADYAKNVHALAEKSGCTILDRGWALTDNHLFADRLHLNREGAKWFTDEVVAAIK